MAASTQEQSGKALLNVPNQVTSARLVLSIVLFVFLGLGWYRTSLVLFIVAAATDWFDGYWARKYGQVTQLGRILDPFADKIIICGTFIFLVAADKSRVAAWMAVVVVGRELLVTALRSFLEQRGADFSATMSGKLKMVLQCFAVGAALVHLSYLNSYDQSPAWLTTLTTLVDVLLWSAVAITVYSGVAYIFAAIRLLRPGRPD